MVSVNHVLSDVKLVIFLLMLVLNVHLKLKVKLEDQLLLVDVKPLISMIINTLIVSVVLLNVLLV